jgi:1-acyl-sn-glycerol-3-phosphate acyltransferase
LAALPNPLTHGLRFAAAVGLRGWLRTYHRLAIHGRENLPREGSFVMVANHASHLDVLCLLAALPLKKLDHAFPAAAADYFFVNVRRSAMAALLVNAFPFQRRRRVRESLRVCRHMLAVPGNILILFPEGTRTGTGRTGAFKAGIGELLAGAGTPVVPCHVEGAFAAWPKQRRIPWPRKLTLTIGCPRNYQHLPPGRASAVRIAVDLREAVLELAEPQH